MGALGAGNLQHLVGLADARRRAEEDLEPAARAPGEPVLIAVVRLRGGHAPRVHPRCRSSESGRSWRRFHGAFMPMATGSRRFFMMHPGTVTHSLPRA